MNCVMRSLFTIDPTSCGRYSSDDSREDDRDDTGLVDLQRDVGLLAAVLAPADLAFGVLHRDAALALFDVDHTRR